MPSHVPARPIGDLRRLKPGQAVTIGGILTVGQRPPTAKGYNFFSVVEDADGLVEVIVPPDVYERCREALRGPFVVVEGMLQKIRGAISVKAQSIIRV